MADEFYIYGRGDKKDRIKIINDTICYFVGYQEKYPLFVLDVWDIINGIYRPELYDYSKFLKDDWERDCYECYKESYTYKPNSPYFDETKY